MNWYIFIILAIATLLDKTPSFVTIFTRKVYLCALLLLCKSTTTTLLFTTKHQIPKGLPSSPHRFTTGSRPCWRSNLLTNHTTRLHHLISQAEIALVNSGQSLLPYCWLSHSHYYINWDNVAIHCTEGAVKHMNLEHWAVFFESDCICHWLCHVFRCKCLHDCI